jgi:hypothetical protein
MSMVCTTTVVKMRTSPQFKMDRLYDKIPIKFDTLTL